MAGGEPRIIQKKCGTSLDNAPMPRKPDSLRSLSTRLARFAAARDWDQFHNPKNLAMALAGEAGEVLEHFQWLTPEQAANLLSGTRE